MRRRDPASNWLMKADEDGWEWGSWPPGLLLEKVVRLGERGLTTQPEEMGQEPYRDERSRERCEIRRKGKSLKMASLTDDTP